MTVAPSAAPTEPHGGLPSRTVFAAVVVGNGLEFFDFVAYGYFAVYIGKAFFPADTAYGELLMSVAVFGIGFLMRPLGGVLFGRLGDRIGRRRSLLASMALMAAGTMGLALTPSYASIGLAAPFIVVVSRLLQGLALGGEVGPVGAFMVEAAPAGRRARYACWQIGSQGGGSLLAGAIGVACGSLLDAGSMQAWGWRVPFLVGLAIVPLALIVRRTMPETLQAPRGAAPTTRGRPAMPVRMMLLATATVIGGSVQVYVGMYMTTYAMTTLHMPPATALGAAVANGLCMVVFAMLGGWLSDRFGRKPAMMWPRAAIAVFTVPSFVLLLAHPSPAMLFGVSGVLAALGALGNASALVAITEAFPRAHRALGSGASYAIGTSLFGGTAHLVITWLIHVTGNPLAPAWYAAAASLVALLAMSALPETRDRAL